MFEGSKYFIIIVIMSEGRRKNMKTILVPIDGSKYSERAMKKAREFADCVDGSKIILLHIINVRSAISHYHHNVYLSQNSSTLDWPDIIKRARVDASDLLERSKQALEGVNVETVILDEPGIELSQVIVEFAKERDADLIVMGSNGIGSIGRRVYLGSITTKVLHTTDKPVLVIQ